MAEEMAQEQEATNEFSGCGYKHVIEVLRDEDIIRASAQVEISLGACFDCS